MAKRTRLLSRDDRQALKLVEDVQDRYERYEELRDLATAFAKSDPEPPIPDWNAPLTLVFR
jgi:hypothetical protein